MDHDDIDEDDIWNYKQRCSRSNLPATKKNSNTKNVNVLVAEKSTISKKKATTPSTRSKTRKTKGSTNRNPKSSLAKTRNTPTRPKYEGYCSNCQMPFGLLVLQSPNWHLSECVLQQKKPTQECVKGLECTSIIESHYRKYLHTTLAEFRRGKLSSNKRLDFGESIVPANSTILNDNDCADNLKGLKTKLDMGNSVMDADNLCAKKQKISIAQLSVSNNNVTKITEDKLNFVKEEDSPEIIDAMCEQNIGSVSPGAPPIGSISTPSFNCGLQDEDSVSDVDIFEIASVEDGCSSSKIDPDKNDVPNATCSENVISDYKTVDECLTQSVSQNSSQSLSQNLTQSVSQYLSQSLSQKSQLFSPSKNSKTPTKHNRQHTKLKTPSKSPRNNSASVRKKSSGTLMNRTINKKGGAEEKQTSLLSFFKVSSKISSQGVPVPETKPASKKNTATRTFPISKDVLMDQDSCSGLSSSSNANAIAEDTSSGSKKSCPFYKRIPGTKFVVDAFRYGIIPDVSAYFLTHFHYDHYAGLKKSFNRPIYCTKVTGNLVCTKVRVSSKHIRELPMNETVDIEGTKVTALEANHCPGAALLLFHLKDGRKYLHTGDFRAHPSMEQYTALQGIHINQLYLDTTYCDPSYAFPPQDEMIKLAVNIAENAVLENSRTLFVCGTYTIGKERIFIAIANALKTKAFVTREKKTILNCLEDSNINETCILAPENAQVHVIQMNKLNFKDLQSHLSRYSKYYDRIVAFEPTGWTHSKSKSSGFKPKLAKENVVVYGIPYSEHSSYLEMKRFVQFIRSDRIIPTVNNGNAKSRQKMVDIFESWMHE